jgi:putative ABC transport system permease protein
MSSKKTLQIPALANLILKKMSLYNEKHSIIEDFETTYQEIAKTEGIFKAYSWCWMSVIRSLSEYMKLTFKWRLSMLNSYLKISLRILLRNKSFSFINIAGLSAGLACTLLIVLWVQYEFSFDKFHSNYNNLYRVVTDFERGNQKMTETMVPVPLGDELKNTYPEITHAAIFTEYSQFRIEAGGKVGFNQQAGFTEPDFFELFSFPLVSGDPKTCLKDKNSIVFTEKTAEYYFGDKNPIGETVLFGVKKFPLEVTGVIKDPPDNSHIQFKVLVPVDPRYGVIGGKNLTSWESNVWSLYLLARSDIDPASFTNKISELYKTHHVDKTRFAENIRSRLQPLKNIHMKSDVDFDTSNHFITDIKYVYIFVSIAAVVFIIACLNFMCMATARSARREKEVGIRKISGAFKTDLVRQFMSESFVLVIISFVFAIGLVYLLLPLLNEISGKEINFALLNKWHILISACLVTIITGLFSGSYPALYLSSLKPASLFRGYSLSGRKSGFNLRKLLVTVQYLFTIALLFVSLVLFKQMNFISNKDLGFSYENVVSLDLPGGIDHFEAVKNEILIHHNVISVTQGIRPSLRDQGHSAHNIDWEGKEADFKIGFDWLAVSYDYDKTFGMTLKEGRFFSKAHPEDTSNYVLNETAVKAMNLKDPIGKKFGNKKTEGKIIGVIKDFHFSSLRKKIRPLFLAFSEYFGLSVKIRPENQNETIKHLAAVWEKFEPEEPFAYSFFDESIQRMYMNERKTEKLMQYFTFLTILIFFMGLFGLIGYVSQQRTKEIGIRKILGASTSNITSMIFKDFIKLLLIASVFSFPVGYYIGAKWLENFAYRINIGVGIFIIIFIFIFSFSFMIVFFQTFRVALINPSDTLRYE